MNDNSQADISTWLAQYEVMVTVPREAPDASLVPYPLPVIDGVITAWKQDQVIIGVTVEARNEAVAAAAAKDVARKFVGNLAQAQVTLRLVDADMDRSRMVGRTPTMR
jgi:hypothetical protein